MLTLAAIAATLLVWGAHAVVPGAVQAAPAELQRVWRLGAPPAALAATLLLIFSLAQQPDLALAAGLGPGWPTSTPASVGVALLLAGLLGDVALLLRAARTPFDWRAARILGISGTIGAATLGEVTRIGAEPTLWTTFLAGAGCRLILGVASGEAFVARPPRWGILAALAVAAYPFVLPGNGAAVFLHSGDLLTLSASALLFAAARFMPARLRRPAVVGAALLAALVLTRMQVLSSGFATQTPPAISME